MRRKPLDVRKFPRRTSRMTIAIGTYYDKGIIVCADSKVVASDGATTNGLKLSLALGQNRRFIAIANAAEDGHAATMLSDDIAIAIGDAQDEGSAKSNIKAVMTTWHNAYGSQSAPHLQFVVGIVAPGERDVLLCEPPATVIEDAPVAIGRGARAVERFLELEARFLTGDSPPMKVALLRLAFLMYHAKKEEGSACGGDTHAVILPSNGILTFVNSCDMADAEGLAKEVDALMTVTGKKAMSHLTEADQNTFVTAEFSKRYAELARKARELTFPSLVPLHNVVLGEKKSLTADLT